jgi:hypothetical protein
VDRKIRGCGPATVWTHGVGGGSLRRCRRHRLHEDIQCSARAMPNLRRGRANRPKTGRMVMTRCPEV